MDWGPQQLSTAEQAAAGTFFFEERTVFFEKSWFLSPQTLFTAEQVAAGIFCCFLTNDMPFEKATF